MHFIGVYDYTVILTYLSLFSAVFGMVLSSRAAFTGAVLCLMFSGLCDAFDGIVARSKRNRTEDEKAFGIQLDSLCDVVSFGVFPAYLCYHLGTDGTVGILCILGYCMCAVCRLAFFNVLEGKRQQTESGCNKFYRGLPVTAISMIFPALYGFRFLIPEKYYVALLCMMLATVAFLFVLDISVKKPDWKKILHI